MTCHGVLLTVTDLNGNEVYSQEMALNDMCHGDLLDYAGIWTDKDPREGEYQQGCAYVSRKADCTGDFDPVSLTFSCMSLSITTT